MPTSSTTTPKNEPRLTVSKQAQDAPSPTQAPPSQRKVESIAELRRICQDPVRQYNDLTGQLYGWRFSIYITRFFLSLGLGASFASVLMVVCGVGGSLLLIPGGVCLPIGLFVLTMAYVLDCVDGEMARYQQIDSLRWASIDFIHHMLTKGLSFLCLGVGLYVEYGFAWTLGMGGACSIFWLLLMGVRDLPTALFAKKVVLCRDPANNPAYQRLLKNLAALADKAALEEGSEKPAPQPPKDIWGADFKFQRWMIRTFFMAFDIAIPLLCLATIADLWLPTFSLGPLGPLSAASAILLAYTIVLPIQLVDSLRDALPGRQLRNELYELAALHKTIERRNDPDEANDPDATAGS